MALTKKNSRAAPAPSFSLQATFPLWGYLLSFAAVLYALFEVYGPAIHGPFVFDDLYLPYSNPHAGSLPLKTWLGVRPVLGLSFWTDFHLWGSDTLPYHVVNLLLHFAAGIVLFFIFRKLLVLAQTNNPTRVTLSAFGTALFLFHPIQTEVAAYIASRSEALSVLFFLAAFCAFLYRPTTAIRWPAALGVLALFLLAIGTKEHTVTLPALLLLTDYFWNPGFSFLGIRGNARLYIPIACFALVGALLMLRYISSDPMIGFHIEGLNAGTYFLTQCRAVFKYIQLFFLPAGQNVDYDFPLSHNLAEHGALIALAVIVLLSVAAFLFRKLYPFAAYGFFVFLLLLSPTSSFVPINDVLVERRLYLPLFGLILILFEPLRRIRVRPFALAGGLALLCCVAAYATWERAQIWSTPMALFQDAAQKSPGKARVHIGYANALYHQGRCREAVAEYGTATSLKTSDYILLFNLAAAYECMNDSDDSVTMLNRSIALNPQANAYALLGKIQGKQGKFPESLDSFNAAIKLNYKFPPTYIYRAAVYIAMGSPQLAYEDYAECLRFDPGNQLAQQGMALLTQRR